MINVMNYLMIIINSKYYDLCNFAMQVIVQFITLDECNELFNNNN